MHASTIRIMLSREKKRRGIIDIKNIHNKQASVLRSYFITFHVGIQNSELFATVCNADDKCILLNLCDRIHQENEILFSNIINYVLSYIYLL